MIERVQQREGRECIIDLVGKHHSVRTIPMPTWAKVAIDVWATKVDITEGRMFRPVNRGDCVVGDAVSEKTIWQLLRPYATAVGSRGSRLMTSIAQPQVVPGGWWRIGAGFNCCSAIRRFRQPSASWEGDNSIKRGVAIGG
jgi:hypothetical protein